MSDHDSLTVAPEQEQEAPLEQSEAIESRFLFVDVAAQRAKQLRRGARQRLNAPGSEPSQGWRPDQPHKLERIAMEEVKRRLVLYTLPPAPSTRIVDAG
jgi:DNA-directed RNA polymerase subunit K/omega